MLFNPSTKQLFTNQGDLIKTLHCPRGAKLSDMRHTDSTHSMCNLCEGNIINTKNLNDKDVLSIISKDASTCLKLELNDPNIRIINHNAYKSE